MAIGRVNTGGGGTGATLVITGVAGDTCIITNGSKTKTKTFDSSGTATFKGLATGTWTVTMTNTSGSTATRTVTINADYTLGITYFSATIEVTYPEGSTCTCSDGSTTLTASDTSGSYTFTVGNTGTWTVTCTNGEDTTSQDVSITTEGQTETVVLTFQFFIYNAGIEGVALTVVARGNQSGTNGTEKRENYIYIDNQAGSYLHNYYTGTAKTDAAVNLANYSKVCCTWSNNGGFTPIIGVKSEKLGDVTWTNVDDSAYDSFAQDTTAAASGTLALDITAVTGEMYVGVSFLGRALEKLTSVKLISIWLEP